MAPAKITTSEGKVLFVPEGEEIAAEGREEHFSEDALKDLVQMEIHGTYEGFRVVDVLGRKRTKYYSEWGVRGKEGRDRKVLIGGLSTLKLRDGTKIEPVTEEQMEWYKKRVERR